MRKPVSWPRLAMSTMQASCAHGQPALATHQYIAASNVTESHAACAGKSSGVRVAQIRLTLHGKLLRVAVDVVHVHGRLRRHYATMICVRKQVLADAGQRAVEVDV